MVTLMGGVCEQPPLPHKPMDRKTVVYLLLLLGFYAWLHSNGELIPVLQLGAKLLYYCGIAWGGLYLLDFLLRILLRVR
jgi:hypothetical protein